MTKTGMARWLGLALLLSVSLVHAQDAEGLNLINSSTTANGGQTYSLSVRTLLLLSSLSFLPAALMMMTSFTRIIIVLSLLRQTIGAQGVPPNQILLGLSLFLTFFVMQPVFDKIYVDAYEPFSENKITMTVALDRGVQPLKEFMLRQTRQHADLVVQGFDACGDPDDRLDDEINAKWENRRK